MTFVLTTQRSLLLGCTLILLYLLLSSQISSLSPPAPPAPSVPRTTHHFSVHSTSPSPSSSSPSSPPLLDHVDSYSFFPPSSHPLSSTAELHYLTSTSSPTSDYLSYPLCSFTHVCLTPSTILFRFPNRADWEAAKALIDECAPGRARSPRTQQFDLCHCFYQPELSPALMAFDAVADEDAQSPAMRLYADDPHRPGRPLRKDAAAGGGVVGPADGAVSNAQLLSSLPSSSTYYAGEPSVGAAMTGSSPPVYAGHYWTVQKYVRGQHHIGHWAQRVVLMSAVMQHSPSIPLPPIDGVVVQDTDAPMSPHESAMLNISLWSMLTKQDHPLLARYLGASPHPSSALLPNQLLPMERLTGSATGLSANASGLPPHTCVERLSYPRSFGIFSTNNHDTMAYRAVAYAQYGVAGLSHRCPPRRIALLTRDNRRILNQQAIIDWVSQTFHKPVDVININSSSTPAEQISAFASTGLLLASHSSQLVNVVFSHPRAAMVEIAPEYYNSDFSEYAHGMGVFFRYALGGKVPGAATTDSMQRCLALLDECEGDSYCILLKRFEKTCKERYVCCKYMDGFEADMDRVKVAVQHAVNHLNWACGEQW